jgi:hypothetical protein
MGDVVARISAHSSVYEDGTEFIHIGPTWRGRKGEGKRNIG